MIPAWLGKFEYARVSIPIAILIWLMWLPHDTAAPAGMMGASDFFELSVAAVISLFGTSSPVALAAVVGVLVEVPAMLTMVNIANHTRHWFPSEQAVK